MNTGRDVEEEGTMEEERDRSPLYIPMLGVSTLDLSLT